MINLFCGAKSLHFFKFHEVRAYLFTNNIHLTSDRAEPTGYSYSPINSEGELKQQVHGKGCRCFTIYLFWRKIWMHSMKWKRNIDFIAVQLRCLGFQRNETLNAMTHAKTQYPLLKYRNNKNKAHKERWQHNDRTYKMTKWRYLSISV